MRFVSGVVACLILACAAGVASAATITASPGGGAWHYGSTWVGGSVPTPSDDVVLNSTSGNVTATGKAVRCRSLDCTGYAGTLRLETALRVGTMANAPGPLVLAFSSGMTFSYGSRASLQVNSSEVVRGVRTAGKKLPSVTAYNVVLEDELECVGLSVAYSFDADGHAVTSDTEITCYSGSLDIAGAIVRCQQWHVSYASSVDAANSTITIAGTTGRPAFVDSVREYHNIVIDSTGYAPYSSDGLPAPACVFGDYYSTPNLVLNSLSVISAGETELAFRDGSAFHLMGDKAWPSGTQLGNVVMRSTVAGVPWFLSSGDGAVEVEYATISDSVTSGGASFAGGVGSIDAGGNVGWGF